MNPVRAHIWKRTWKGKKKKRTRYGEKTRWRQKKVRIVVCIFFLSRVIVNTQYLRSYEDGRKSEYKELTSNTREMLLLRLCLDVCLSILSLSFLLSRLPWFQNWHETCVWKFNTFERKVFWISALHSDFELLSIAACVCERIEVGKKIEIIDINA